MEEIIRNNVVEFSLVYLDKQVDSTLEEFNQDNFTYYIFMELFNIDITKSGFGLDLSTKEMTNDIGDLRIYKKDDINKINYIEEIKKGDLLFFHTKDKDDNSPTPSNHYPGHVGIYLGEYNFIHVDLNTEKVVIDSLKDNWLNDLIGSRDIIKSLILKSNI